MTNLQDFSDAYVWPDGFLQHIPNEDFSDQNQVNDRHIFADLSPVSMFDSTDDVQTSAQSNFSIDQWINQYLSNSDGNMEPHDPLNQSQGGVGINTVILASEKQQPVLLQSEIESGSFDNTLTNGSTTIHGSDEQHEEFSRWFAPHGNNPRSTALQSRAMNQNLIEILAQPRAQYRPRTELESLISSHFVRSDDHPNFGHPAIRIPSGWEAEFNNNYIEVALVDLQKNDHLYILTNKSSKPTFKKLHEVVQQKEQNILYFRLNDEDFKNGYKTFAMELLKPKQGGAINKKVIQERKLSQSMLRFTRVHIIENNQLIKDNSSEVYSCVMTETYGQVSVEHISPICGPMNSETKVFILLKSRATRNELNVYLTRTNSQWMHQVDRVTCNGTVAYFTIPSCPFQNESNVRIDINIEFKGEHLHTCSFHYLALIDRECSTSSSPMSTNVADYFPAVRQRNSRRRIPSSNTRQP